VDSDGCALLRGQKRSSGAQVNSNKLARYLIVQRGVTARFFDQNFSDPEGSFAINAERIINHPEYDENKGNMDFCLLKLMIRKYC
jgi:hypothetical protein